MIRGQQLIFALLVALILPSCTGEQYARRSDEVVEVPDRYAEVSIDSTQARDGWCSDFGQPELDGLVDQALSDNLNLRAAWSRYQQAEAIQDQADANMWPQVSLEASAGRSKQPVLGAASALASSFEQNNFQISAPVSYEVDLFGRLAAQRSAAEYDTLAARADVESFAVSLAAQVAEAWFDLIRQRELIALLRDQNDVNRKFLELTKLRLAQGSATALDVNQQQQSIYRIDGQIRLAEAQQRISSMRLAVLLGEPPNADIGLGDVSELPELTPFPDAGVPADILDERPDVRSARLRLESADERTAAAARALLPSIRLTASPFLQAAELGEFFEQIFWSVTASASQTVFDGGRRHAAVRQSEAAARERLFTYGQTVLVALQEVESALIQEEKQQQFVEDLEKQRQTAEISLRLARERYQSGVLDYLRVLTALQSLQNIEQSLVDARRQQLSNRVQTCRALGGDWTRDLEPKELDGDKP